MSQDVPQWKGTASGVFTIRSAYEALNKAVIPLTNQIWRHVWTLKIPQRCKTFLWTCLHGCLLTNVARWERGLTESNCCSLCEEVPESNLHALRDCRNCSLVWVDLLPQQDLRVFMSIADIHQWVAWTLKRKTITRGVE